MELAFSIPAPGRSINFVLDLDNRRQHERWLLEHYFKDLCYEAEVAIFMSLAVREGDFVVDVGANLGFFTVLLAKLAGPTGKVIAVEPEEENFANLYRHIAMNGLGNVTVSMLPVGSALGPVTFWLNSDDGSSSCLWDPGKWHENVKSRTAPKPVRREATTLDVLVGDCKPRLIKIDIEGAEETAMRGAANLLASDSRPDFVVSELNPFGMQQMGGSAETYRDYMRQFGYEMFFLHANGGMPTWVPRGVRVKYVNDVQVKNVLFTTPELLTSVWKDAIG